MSFGSFVKDAGKAVVRGAAQGGGLISTPFKAVQVGANTIGGIKKNLYKFKKPRKSHFRKKTDQTLVAPPKAPKM